jgi:two-component system, sensor histidine kinase LadS
LHLLYALGVEYAQRPPSWSALHRKVLRYPMFLVHAKSCVVKRNCLSTDWRNLGRLVALALLLVAWIGYAQAQSTASPAITQIAAPAKSLVLPTVVGTFSLPLTVDIDPETVWKQTLPIAQPANPHGRWRVEAGQRSVAKFTVTAQAEHIHTLEFPAVRLDQVDVFWRSPGGRWSLGRAGDTVALSQWPVVGQYPMFVLHFDSTPGSIDVLVVMQNAGFVEVAATIAGDRESRERRLLQANATGLMIGASAMVLLVCLLMCVVYRRKSTVYLLAYCIAVTVGTVIINGYGAIWFTPDWPVFNDHAKPFAATLICAAMLCACTATLNSNTVGRVARLLVTMTVVALLAHALAQLTLLSPSLRLAGGVVGAVSVVVIGLGMGLNSWRRGDRLAPWVLLSIVFFALSGVVVARGFMTIHGVDLFPTLPTALFVASILALRHAQILRERYGLAVLGRAEINRYRDPLTALLSYEGFERAVENLSVRQHSGGGVAHVLYFSMTDLNNFRAEDGYLVWQRDMVRFAAVLQRALGEGWHIARLSNSRFGAVRLDDHRRLQTEPLLTLVLSSCTRKIDTHGWVDRVGLRMAGVSTPLTASGLKESLRVLEQTVQNLPPGKRIALL